MVVLIIVVYVIFGLVTTGLVSLAASATEGRVLSPAEMVLTLLFWPYFLVALIIHLNTP
jgi:hypothetical protein